MSAVSIALRFGIAIFSTRKMALFNPIAFDSSKQSKTAPLQLATLVRAEHQYDFQSNRH
jgi:hypothetical protein